MEPSTEPQVSLIFDHLTWLHVHSKVGGRVNGAEGGMRKAGSWLSNMSYGNMNDTGL